MDKTTDRTMDQTMDQTVDQTMDKTLSTLDKNVKPAWQLNLVEYELSTVKKIVSYSKTKFLAMT